MSRDSLRQRREQVLRALTSILGHESIHDDEGGHGFDDRNSTGYDAGVVTALSLEGALFEAVGGSRLGLADGGRGLECDAEVNGGTVGDAALDTAGIVGLGGQTLLGDRFGAGAGFNVRDDEGIVVDGAGHFAAAEARADFEALCCRDAEHGVCELGFELIEAGLAESDGHVADHAGYGAADAVLVVAELLDDFGHAGCGVLVGAAGRHEGVDGFAADVLNEVQEFGVGGGGGVLRGGGEEVLVADGGDEGDDLNAVGETQVLLSNGSSGDTA